MKKQSYILKIGVALTLLLFSVGIRSNMFTIGYSIETTCSAFSTDDSQGTFTSLDNTSFFSLICEDHSSDDDDDDSHGYIALDQRNDVREFYRNKHFCYCLNAVSSILLFSSDVSPPRV